MTIGYRIRNLRETLGLSQIDVANTIGVSKQTLYKYEHDIVSNIPSDKIESLARKLNTTPAYLMGWEDENGELTLLGRVGTSYIKGDFLSTVTDDEIEILARLRSIPEKDKARVLDLLDSYYQEYKDEKKESSLA